MSALESSGPEETRRLGQALGRAAEAGDVILLSGELGAGKTVFVQGMARGLDFQGPVSSKSFVLLGEYAGRITLFHADLYRLESPVEVEELALEEISSDGVLVVEWPERGDVVLPEERLTLLFEVSGPETRRITAEATGARAQALAEALGE
ncbi:MAG: tRNA (adenosine(37)-N6)-threonylcarbamoyltransferase complex ATPase subunit type 1 TsaE [Chloroflexi bacterium]|nr:tRNA (adenosine(37)-N6)-threonylcarbamoyltransferase complex ATPase subunit type 1 TsaE [Chloroflexota bacterium]MCI0814146.1 tRNA (adenosine(37)-N6)-threonylcarbamoyltransferase complex ATPase subunit type 1 TsaE [Chloroflexota bacterium]MCI0816925.1 tRNA (adenosine(37)-N6)-threonylcarbamoyltransferase complex ATPase subunit type 1 TsaE [Chloroflexota bacterium]MCI0818788.1 tRNA (adenosine(37)-N6)-threonylcarbamoyltransferase complex ATPase subunit type 1 TsaE [Chloroflexota bacterium]MCI08